MVSDQSQSWTPSSKAGTNPVSTNPATERLGDTFSPSLTDAAHPLPLSNAASSSYQHPPDPSGSTHTALRGAESSSHNSSISEDDIVIAVMGLTGAGKSSFVNMAAGRTEVVIGDDLKSKTRDVQHVRCLHPDGRRNVVLVDTPGFDDTERSDAEILRSIADWLKVTYQNQIKLSGLLYLHRISDVRMAGTPLRNLSVFKDLCGDNKMKNIVLVTTMWDEFEDKSIGFEREEELFSDFWKDMILLGSRTCRFQGTRESAWEIINHLDLEGSAKKCTPLKIQQEMVDRGLQLHETTAAKTFVRSLAGEAKKFWAKLRNKSRWKTTPREPSISLRLRHFPSRSSTIRSSSSDAGRSVDSSTGSSRITSRNSTPLSSPAESTWSYCSMNGRQDILSVTIKVLGCAHQMADIAHIPMLRGIIGTALYIAKHIQDMGGIHHAISQVIESTGWLLDEITRYAMRSELSRDMKRALNSFQRELNNLQKVVIKISSRGRIAGFFLYDADIQTITACTASIRTVFDKLEIKLAIDNRQAIARLECQLTALSASTVLRKCECGMWAAPREEPEAQANGQPSVSTCHSRDC
ncbi:hypothetical protein EV363DRAFT_1164405 [Boletus edulis]|nr:hypothetical protein EV363DRAFT_1164405 [Boletus edulis]